MGPAGPTTACSLQLHLQTPPPSCLPTLSSCVHSCLPTSLPLFISSSLRTFLPSYLPTTFLLPSYLPNQRFHSTTQSLTVPTSQPTNNQATVEEVTSSFPFRIGRGGFPITPREPCYGLATF